MPCTPPARRILGNSDGSVKTKSATEFPSQVKALRFATGRDWHECAQLSARFAPKHRKDLGFSSVASHARVSIPFGLPGAKQNAAKGVCVVARRATTERRRWQRLPLAIPVFVRGGDERGKEFLEFANALNISAGGALLVTRRYLPRSSKVSLEIPSAPLPNLASKPYFVRTLQARVVRLDLADKYHLWGVQFTRPLI